MENLTGNFQVYLYETSKKVWVYIGKKKINKGILWLEDTPKGPRIKKFMVENQPVNPKEFLKLIKNSRVCLLETARSVSSSKLVHMLADYQIPFETLKVCRFCLMRHKITPKLSIRYMGEEICEECAKRELRNYIVSEYSVRVLRKCKDLDHVINLIEGKINKELKQFTLFDVISPKTETISREEIPDSEIPDFVKKKLPKTLLPVQTLALKAGVLRGENILVVSETASGKTLVGEMAGMKMVFEGRGVFLYLVPLVALALQKYEQFKERWGDIVGLVIGRTRIRTKHTEYDIGMKSDVSRNVVVGTYEAVDQLIMSGFRFQKVGCIVVDEIHMLMDDERGHRLDGLIARLRYLFPDAQFIYLSATVGFPEELAKMLGARLVKYEHRPIPLKRYVVPCVARRKSRIIKRIVDEAWSEVSSKGYRGQTIVFTNSRRRCEELARVVGGVAYHAGLSKERRKEVQKRFEDGKIKCVVTTSALGAGVDFPASCVIFDSLRMGAEELTQHEFNQMLGRAGRPDYHDEGSVFLLVSPEEEEIADVLLHGGVGRCDVMCGGESEEVLAMCSITDDVSELKKMCSMMVRYVDVDKSLRELEGMGMLKREGNCVKLTRLGRTASLSFLPP